MIEQQYPEWMSKEAVEALHAKYLGENETPRGMYRRLARRAQEIYPEIGGLENALFEAFWKGWIGAASPVASNFGKENGVLPVSCFGLNPKNSVFSIFSKNTEAAMLSKNGGGLGLDLSNLIGASPVTHWARQYDTTAANVSQTGVRRGSIALYCDIDHPDIDQFLNAKDLLKKGDSRGKLDCNIAVKISDNFMERLGRNDPRAVELFARVLRLRMQYGSPYIFFIDNAQRADPPCYKKNGLKTYHSQLCAEIDLFSDENHTYACVLSSLVASRFDEWKDYTFLLSTAGGTIKATLPYLATIFLDAVCEEFINLGKHIKGIESAVRGAIKGRPLGLGVLGLHDYFQQHGWAWGSKEALDFDVRFHKYIRERAEAATRMMAFEYGEPEWCQGFERRNTHLLAIAPTLSNMVLCDGESAGISPKKSNGYIYDGPNGIYFRKNKRLVALLGDIGMDTREVWDSIKDRDGSVQHLDFLSREQKDVFKTAIEIDQSVLIRHASKRQDWICQGQSFNFFIDSEEIAENIARWHIEAWRLGLKSLYYIRSTSPMNKAANRQSMTLEEDKPGIHNVKIATRPDCIYCTQAKDLLQSLGIPYEESYKAEGKVPEININGEILPDGYTSLKKLLNVSYNEQPDCDSCDG